MIQWRGNAGEGYSVIERADGTYQVTIDGKPLYYYVKDAKPGDTNGQGVLSVWYVVQEVASQ